MLPEYSLGRLRTVGALSAARLSVELRLPMADSIMLATAQTRNATLWTQDVDFRNVQGVQYVEKQSWAHRWAIHQPA